MLKENKEDFLEVPVFVSRGKRPYAGICPAIRKKSFVSTLTTRGKIVFSLLLVLLISSFLFWL